jgi:hypothetical protein
MEGVTVRRPGVVGLALLADPVSEWVRFARFTLFVIECHPEVFLALEELLCCRVAAGPVLPFGVDHVEGNPLCDHHGVMRRCKTQQQTIV